MSEPGYLALHASGELARRAEVLRGRLACCDLCPHACGVDRLAGEMGTCGIGATAVVASAAPHAGEEAPLVGRHGSGTIFLAGCNLRCVFCQNHDISMAASGRRVSDGDLAAIMLGLQRAGCHNINLVTPTHVVPMIVAALDRAAARGLRVPLVYNTGGYDAVDVLEQLAGVVDVYMPDAKLADGAVAARLCNAPDYPEVNREALRVMHGQVGDLVLDHRGLAVRGLLVRHLVLPGDLAGTDRVMEFLARDLSTETYVNVMDQYRPCHLARRDAAIARRPTAEEIQQARADARRAGLTRLDPGALRPPGI